MTLSKTQARRLHAALIGFVTGALTAVQIGVAAGHFTEKGALLSVFLGVVTGGISHAAGGLLAVIQTDEDTMQAAQKGERRD